MKVLVTGHDGYIGAVMVPVLQAAGHQVVGVDTCFFSDGRHEAMRPENLAAVRVAVGELPDLVAGRTKGESRQAISRHSRRRAIFRKEEGDE